MLSIELHPRTYDLPIYDPAWLAFFPGLRPESLAAVVRLAATCERRFADGSLARPEVVEADPLGRPRPRLARPARSATSARSSRCSGGSRNRAGCRFETGSGDSPGLHQHRDGLLPGPLGGGVAAEHGGELVDALGRRRAA